MVTTPVTSWGEAVMTSLVAALAMFLGAIPKVIGFLVILLIGWLIASALAKAVAALLRAVKFNDLAQRSGLSGFIQNMGMRTDASGLIATLAKWFVRLIVLVAAFDALGLPAVSQVLQQLLLWLPNLVVALVILVIAGLAANALASLVRGSAAEAGLSNPDLLSTIAQVAVMAFAVVIAVNQIGVAQTLVNTLFMGLTGALALALGLAFGLGGRDTAAEIVRTWLPGVSRPRPRWPRRQMRPSDGRGLPRTIPRPRSQPARRTAASPTVRPLVLPLRAIKGMPVGLVQLSALLPAPSFRHLRGHARQSGLRRRAPGGASLPLFREAAI